MFVTDTPIVYTTPALSRLKTETFLNAADAVLVWKTRVAFQCKEMETFENDGVAAHILSAYTWWPCKQ